MAKIPKRIIAGVVMILSGRQATRATDVTKMTENPSQNSANKLSDFSKSESSIVLAIHEPALTEAPIRVSETAIKANTLTHEVTCPRA
jgi:hypothetical protein